MLIGIVFRNTNADIPGKNIIIPHDKEWTVRKQLAVECNEAINIPNIPISSLTASNELVPFCKRGPYSLNSHILIFSPRFYHPPWFCQLLGWVPFASASGAVPRLCQIPFPNDPSWAPVKHRDMLQRSRRSLTVPGRDRYLWQRGNRQPCISPGAALNWTTILIGGKTRAHTHTRVLFVLFVRSETRERWMTA